MNVRPDFVHASLITKSWLERMQRRMAMNQNEESAGGEQRGERSALPELNFAHVAGRLTNSPKLRDYGPDKNRAQFILAVPRPSRTTDAKRTGSADFLAVVAWRAAAKQCEGLSKGDAVEVQGRIRTWHDKTDKLHWEIEADTVRVIERHSARTAENRQQELAGV